ncbi:MAG: pyridoxal 5'-phosphate synthase glutaminase subunit PdxT [Candidatus Dormibacteria bacterium]
MTAPRIGVLALQGDVREHAATFARLGAQPELIRFPDQLQEIDALALPGGESTTMSRLLRVFALLEPLRERLDAGLPTFSTCAGAILLSREILDGRPDQVALGALDLAVRRNGYGRQVESFEADLRIEGLEGEPFRAVFIRAPVFERVGAEVKVLASYDGKAVAIAQGKHLSLAFHPEMTRDDRLHRLFLTNLSRRRENAA